MWLEQMLTPDQVLATDACLRGIGGICGKHYFHEELPSEIADDPNLNVAHFEMIAVIIALKSWPHKLRGIWFRILCDNQSMVSVLNTGRARDFKLQQLLREVMWVQALHSFEMQVEYITTKQNRTADILSRAIWGENTCSSLI